MQCNANANANANAGNIQNKTKQNKTKQNKQINTQVLIVLYTTIKKVHRINIYINK
jgi:hypothetical protein